MPVKVCCRCNESKPAIPEFFYWRKKNNLPHSWCKVCHKAWFKDRCAKNPDRRRKWREAWVEKNRGRLALTHRKNQLRRMYGLTEDGYDRLYREQNGLCKICKGVPKDRMQVDHDHVTGVVRGLLCGPCNRGLAGFLDDPSRMRTAASYIELSKQVVQERGHLVQFPTPRGSLVSGG